MNMKEKNFISVITYVHNNSDRYLSFLRIIGRVLDEHFDNYEIILVNDASSTECMAQIKQNIKQEKYKFPITVVNLKDFQGIESGMLAGENYAIGDFIYEFDTLNVDYDIDMIMKVYYRALEGFDIVSAVPKNTNVGFSYIFYKIYNTSSKQGKIYHETFRILSRRAWNRILSINSSIPYRKAIYNNCGLKTDYYFYDNKKNTLKYSEDEKKHRFSLAIDSFIIFTNIFEKISFIFSCSFAIFALLVLGYTFFIYFGKSRPVEGWAPIMGFLSMAFFGVFSLMTITLKYLSLILKTILTQQDYLIESTERIIMEDK